MILYVTFLCFVVFQMHYALDYKLHIKVLFLRKEIQEWSWGVEKFCSVLIVLCLKLSPDHSGESPAT